MANPNMEATVKHTYLCAYGFEAFQEKLREYEQEGYVACAMAVYKEPATDTLFHCVMIRDAIEPKPKTNGEQP